MSYRNVLILSGKNEVNTAFPILCIPSIDMLSCVVDFYDTYSHCHIGGVLCI